MTHDRIRSLLGLKGLKHYVFAALVIFSSEMKLVCQVKQGGKLYEMHNTQNTRTEATHTSIILFQTKLLLSPFTPTVKPQVTQSHLTTDSMYRPLKCDHSLESCVAVLYCGTVC